MKYRPTTDTHKEQRKLTDSEARGIADSLFTGIEWDDDKKGYMPCPGGHHHTTSPGRRDCMITIGDSSYPPGVTCFHKSCQAEVEEAAKKLRSELGKAEWVDMETPRHQNMSKTDDFQNFIDACFLPDEHIAIASGYITDEGHHAISSGCSVITAKEWAKRASEKGGIDRCFGSPHGVYVRVNPVKSGGQSDKDVVNYRHTLIESDDLPRVDQERILRESGLPISALIDSGGKSIHAWVKIEANNLKEYHERRKKIWDSLKGVLSLDEKNQNPSRYSRLPGGKRGTVKQRLLDVNLGAPSYDAWEKGEGEKSPIENATEFIDRPITEPPQIIHGVLYQGAKMILAGPSKARKTWNLIDLAMSIANGSHWIGFATEKSKVLYINLELQEFSIQKRLHIVKSVRGHSNIDNLSLWNLRGKDQEITHIVDEITRIVKTGTFQTIIIDPIYKTYGDRSENDAGEMSVVLHKIEQLALRQNCCVIFAAHFPKGNLSERSAMDRVGGSGVFARDADTLITMTPHEDDEEGFIIDLTLRDMPPRPSFCIRWEGQHFSEDMTLSVTRPQGCGKKKQATSKPRIKRT